MTEALAEFIRIMTSGLTSYGKGFGEGIQETVKSLFFAVSEQGAVTGLSTFGGFAALCAAIALSVGACRFIMHLVRSR